PTGMAIALPDGYAAFIHPRSGLGARLGVTIVNAPGTVDAGYRGEIKVTLLNTDPRATVTLRRGDRIAQMVVQRVERAVFHEVAELPGSARGTDGFGSTGGFGSPGDFGPARVSGDNDHSREGARVVVFGRRRRADEPRKGAEANAEPAEAAAEEAPAEEAPAEAGSEGRGPWDSEDSFPEMQRLDFGSLQVPVVEGLGFQVNFEPTRVDEQ